MRRDLGAFVGMSAVVIGLGAAAAVLHAGDAREPAAADGERALYVMSGPVAQRLMLSFDALAADVYWIRTVQHYGRDRRSLRVTGRFDLLKPLLDLTTALDPQFSIAYRFGAVFLAQPPPSGPGRPDQAVALLQRGLRDNPNKWQFAFDIGFTYYWNGADGTPRPADFETAADWFERAGAMPGAPIWLRQLAATTRAQGGDRERARAMLDELANSEEEWLRRAAARARDQLQALDVIDELQRRLDAFKTAHPAAPATWAELIPGGPANPVPIDPAGAPYVLDAAAGRIELNPKSPLFPLPPSSSHK